MFRVTHNLSNIVRISGISLFLASCSSDLGGSLAERDYILNTMKPVKGWYPIPGECLSSCTEILSKPKVCTHRLNTFWVHAGSYIYNPNLINHDASKHMFDSWSAFPKFQQRVLRDGALNSLQFTKYRGYHLHADGVPYCPAGVRYNG